MDIHTLHSVVKIIDDYLRTCREDIPVCRHREGDIRNQMVGADDIRQLVKIQIEKQAREMANEYNEEEDQLYV
jgi:hypothetical protein